MFTILLVEDDHGFREAIRNMVCEEFSSLTISEAGNGDEALGLIRSKRPNLVLMDIKLPGRNGLDILKEIAASDPDIPVIILTSYDFPEYREVALQYGAEQFLVKGTTRRDDILALVAARMAAKEENSDESRNESGHCFNWFSKASER